ncbi:ABC transporter permease [Pseudomarimonas salicorniae]|uniref:ABC transporter permease n=1 Tax=Pseudomarimonas salicorniae TaxID=2933270 RepID=A0ABT0GH46_9GAMM|nr:ABC transporter permease [Lysobacter sp. CAU 1642]MCK7593534.1 ABC transporter permease [Lysobacter sp. CAU 1642]
MFSVPLTDLRIALRSLARQPGFLAVAVLTLALGVGSVSAIFSVVNGVLLTPLPYADAERIIRINRVQGAWGGPVSAPALADWTEATSGQLEAIGGFVGATVNLTGDGEPERLAAYQVTPGFWQVMGLAPELGRYFNVEEDRRRERLAVISHELWQRRFGGQEGVVGQSIMLNGESYQVVGVTPARFRYPGATQVYLPTFLDSTGGPRGNNYLMVIGRLREGASMEQLEAALAAVNARLAEEFPANHAELGARLTALPEQLNARVEQPLLVLLGAAGLVLLIACANLANLLLARGSARQRELAVRAALGAGRRALVRAVIADALVIALLGAVLGLLIAALGVPLLLSQMPELLPSHAEVGMQPVVVLGALFAGIATVMLFASVPALRAAATAPAGALQEEGRGGSGGRRRSRARNALVAFEVALSLTLLTGAGLLIESLRQLGKVETGVQTEGVLTAAVVVEGARNEPGEDPVDWYVRHTAILARSLPAILERVRAIPGVQSAGLTDSLPLSGLNNASSDITIIGREPGEGERQPGANWRFVSPSLMSTLGMRMVRGRSLEDADARPGEMFQNVLVNETFVRRYLSDVDPLTQSLQFLGGDEPKRIVGVVNDTRLFGIDREPVAEVYMHHLHATQRQLYLALKVSGEPMDYAEQLRRAVREVAPDVPLFEVRSMDQLVEGTTALRRFNMALMSVFSGIALLLAAIGLYGVIAYSVAERRQEIGIRLSLGAQAGDVLRMVLGQGARMVGLGLLFGIAGALALGRLLASELYGVGAGDPRVLLAVVATLGLVALTACAVPALRAARLDPMLALRHT